MSLPLSPLLSLETGTEPPKPCMLSLVSQMPARSCSAICAHVCVHKDMQGSESAHTAPGGGMATNIATVDVCMHTWPVHASTYTEQSSVTHLLQLRHISSTTIAPLLLLLLTEGRLYPTQCLALLS